MALSGPLSSSLQNLSLHSCVRITNRVCSIVAAKAHSLTSLNLRGCMQVSGQRMSVVWWPTRWLACVKILDPHIKRAKLLVHCLIALQVQAPAQLGFALWFAYSGSSWTLK